jgi:hypothetical protein
LGCVIAAGSSASNGAARPLCYNVAAAIDLDPVKVRRGTMTRGCLFCDDETPPTR